MIADLKADSDRWDAERRLTASRGQPSNGTPLRDSNGMVRNSNTPIVGYRDSTTHQSRQYYGPTEAAPGGTPGYPPTSMASQPPVYDNGYPQAYNPPSQQYATPQGYPTDNGNYAYVGADMVIDRDPRSNARPPERQVGTVPRQYASSTTQYQTQADPRGNYYSSNQPPPSAGQTYSTQQHPADPFYGRGAYTHQPFLSYCSFSLSKMNTI